MKKLLLLAIVATFSFGAVLGCKEAADIKDIMYSDKSDRYDIAYRKIELGLCKPIYEHRVVDHGITVSKVRDLEDGGSWYVIATAVSKR